MKDITPRGARQESLNIDARSAQRGNGAVQPSPVILTPISGRISGRAPATPELVWQTADWSALDLLATNIDPPLQWLGGMVFQGCRLLVSGASGTGKTTWSLGLSLAVLRREGFANFFPSQDSPPPPRILYLDYELGRKGMQTFLQRQTPVPDGLFVICFDDPRLGGDGLLPIDTDAGQRQVLAFLRGTGARLIVFDNLYSACIGGLLGGAEKDSAHSRIMPFFKSLSLQGVASVPVHHAGNDASRAYGDNRLTWQMTGHIHLEVAGARRGGEQRIKVTHRKLRYEAPRDPIEMMFGEAEGAWCVVGAETVLRERQKLLVSIVRELASKHNRLNVQRAEVLELYHERVYPNSDRSTYSKQLKRDLDECAAYLRHTSEEVWLVRQGM